MADKPTQPTADASDKRRRQELEYSGTKGQPDEQPTISASPKPYESSSTLPGSKTNLNPSEAGYQRARQSGYDQPGQSDSAPASPYSSATGGGGRVFFTPGSRNDSANQGQPDNFQPSGGLATNTTGGGAGRKPDQNRLSFEQRPEGKAGHEESKPLDRDFLRASEQGASKSAKPDKDTISDEPSDIRGKESSSTQTAPGSIRHNIMKPGERSLFNPNPDNTSTTTKDKLGKFFFGTRRRKLISGVGIGGGVAGVIIFLFLSLVPLKILHITQNLQDRFFATGSNAIKKEVNTITGYYMTRAMGYQKCRHTINKNCTKYFVGETFISRLYRVWNEGKIEDKIIKRFGASLEYRAGEFHLVGADFNGGKSLRLGDFVDGDEKLSFDDWLKKNRVTLGDRNSVVSFLNNGFKDETRHDSVYFKLKVAGYVSKKFGIKMCVVGCFGLKDAANKKVNDYREWKDKKKFAFKAMLAHRVLTPLTGTYGILVTCVFTPGCDPLEIDVGATESDKDGCKSGCLENGNPKSRPERDVDSLIRALVARYGSVAAAIAAYEKFIQSGGFRTAVAQAVGRIVPERGEEEAEKRGSKIKGLIPGKLFPVIGWITLAYYMVKFVDESPEKILKMTYVVNSTADVQLYGLARTHADEMRAGRTDPELSGSFADALSSGSHMDKSDKEKQLGGTAGAEQSPLWPYIMDNKQIKTAGLFSATALAATSTDQAEKVDHLCHEDKPVPAGQIVCPEENLSQKSTLVKALETLKNTQPFPIIMSAVSVFEPMITLIENIIGFIVKLLIVLCSLIPPCGQLINLLQEFVETLLSSIINWFTTHFLLPSSPYSTVMSGSRVFNLTTAGADVSGNDHAHHGLGGTVLTKSQIEDNLRVYYKDKQREFDKKPLADKLFDRNDSRSVVSKVALAMPWSFDNLKTSVASFIGKLPSKFANLFNIFTPRPAYAFSNAWSSEEDPFSVTQYGYRLDDPVFTMDPEKYWNKYCLSTNESTYLTKAWNETAAKEQSRNPRTGMPENLQEPIKKDGVVLSPTGTNGCLLIQSAVGSAGALFSDEFLTPEEKADGGLEGTGGSTSTGDVPDGGIGTAGEFTFPLQTTQSAIRGRGWCYESQSNCHHDYNAADIFAPTGTVVVSPGNCLVLAAKDSSIYPSSVGSRVHLRCGDRIYYLTHMGYKTIRVETGDTITAGTPLGLIGTSADAQGTPPHLHIDALPADEFSERPSCGVTNPCTPYPFINLQPELVGAFGALPP